MAEILSWEHNDDAESRDAVREPIALMAAPSRQEQQQWWLGLVVVLVISCGFMFYFLDRGWIPHDEGTLAHSADRVLAGQLPHRDFIDGYTGGLTFLHALAFRVFGIRLLSMRYVLFIAFVAWVPTFYFAASRLVPVRAAVAATLIAVFWSVPNYPAAMPSWYNMFLATGGVAALLQYMHTSKRRWLLLAGFLGGVSVLIKTTGLMMLAGGLLFLLYHEASRDEAVSDERRSFVVFRIALAALLLIATAALIRIGASRGTWIDFYQFALPGCAMIALVTRRVLWPAPSRSVAVMISRAILPFALGAAVPVLVFISFYAAHGALRYLIHDLLVLPRLLFRGASLIPTIPVGLVPMALMAFIAIDFRSTRLRVLQDGMTLAALSLLVPTTALKLEGLVWASLAEATPVLIPLLALSIATRVDEPQVARSQRVLVGCMAAFSSLVQYPWAAPVYFSYSLPLLVLAVAALVRGTHGLRARSIQGLTGVYLVFGALYIAPMKLPGLLGPIADDDFAELELERGGLKVGREDARDYPVAIELLQAHSPSRVIYAGPDAPELYFLSRLANPTPALFDYLVPDSSFHQSLLHQLDSIGVTAVAIRRRVVHSPPMEPAIQDSLAARFPFARDVGRFTIRWR